MVTLCVCIELTQRNADPDQTVIIAYSVRHSASTFVTKVSYFCGQNKSNSID